MAHYKSLFQEFPPVSAGEWMKRITSDLKGADFNSSLVRKTGEGFDLMPFYRREDIADLDHMKVIPGAFPYLRGDTTEHNNWLIRQDIEIVDYKEANRKAAGMLAMGAESIGFIIKDPDSVNESNIEILLEAIDPERTELNFQPGGKAQELLGHLLTCFHKKGAGKGKAKGSIEADPFSRLMLNGRLKTSIDVEIDYLASLIASADSLPLFRTVQADASNFVNAGAGPVQELALALSMGNEYLVWLKDRGINCDSAASSIKFRFGTGTDYFSGIAKLRAARLLWSAVVKAHSPSDLTSSEMEIHSITGRWNKTAYDPYINLLRTQTEAMAAVLGGTDSLTIEPFDVVFRKPDEFSERLARNQQLLLREEAFFAKVADPAAGSYYIEKLTSLIADESWKLFTDIEEKGGFYSALKKGFIQDMIKDKAIQRQKDISDRKEILVGTNLFPDKDAESIAIKVQDSGKEENDLKEGIRIVPLKLGRAADEIERLRSAALNSDKRPAVFILGFGKTAICQERSQFSSDFFACGGFRITVTQCFSSAEEGVDSALRSGAQFVVLCSSDEEYKTIVSGLPDKIPGKTVVVVSANPECIEELRDLGVKYFINSRSGLTEALREFHSIAGIYSEIYSEG